MIFKWKKFLSVLAVVSILVTGTLSTVPVHASNTWEEVTATETTASFAEDTSYSLLRGNNLNFGTTTISKLSSMEINIYGLTQCHHECDDVYLDIYLERKINGVYSTYKYWEFSAEDVTSMSREINVIVPSGYYYRLRGYHAAADGGIKESTSTLTSGILVN